MSKSEGLTRISKFVHYSGIFIGLLILIIPINLVMVNGGDFGTFEIVLIALSVIIYFIGRGIAWIIEGFAKS